MSRLLLLALLLGALTACSDEIETTPLPDGIAAHIDQSRMERKGREVFLRVENDTAKPITITAFTLTSPRFKTVEWTGDDEIGPTYEADLEFDFPRGRCGTDIDATVEMTYRIGDGDLQRSTTKAADPYDSAALFADRDCAESTLTKAADIEVGDPQVVGVGRDSVLQVPVELTPTGRTTGVRFRGFASTVLFKQTDASPADVDVPLDAADPVTTQVLTVIPSRCDPHALAEDKVGTLFGVAVEAPGLAADSSFYLPLSKPQRSAFFAFFRTHCELE